MPSNKKKSYFEKDDILDSMNGQANTFRGVNCTIHLNRILVLKPNRDSLLNFLTADQSMQQKREILLIFSLRA